MKPVAKYRSADIGLLLIRAVLAAVFIFHGSQKLFGWFGGYGIEGTASWMQSIGMPYPMLKAVLAGGTEFFGGIVLLLGSGTRVAALPMAFTIMVAAATVHRGGFDAQTGGMEYPLTLGVVLMALVLLGPGGLTIMSLNKRSSDRSPRQNTLVWQRDVPALSRGSDSPSLGECTG